MELSEHSKKLLAYKLEQLMSGMITPEQYLLSVKAIYQTENNVEIKFYVEQGFTKKGAFEHVYGLDKGVTLQ